MTAGSSRPRPEWRSPALLGGQRGVAARVRPAALGEGHQGCGGAVSSGVRNDDLHDW